MKTEREFKKPRNWKEVEELSKKPVKEIINNYEKKLQKEK